MKKNEKISNIMWDILGLNQLTQPSGMTSVTQHGLSTDIPIALISKPFICSISLNLNK
jgi:hypothetical protein